MKKFPLFILVTIAIIIAGFLFLKKGEMVSNTNVSPPRISQYFWSETCPHCANVSEFLDSWEKNDRFQIEKFEINTSSENRVKFLKMGMFCKISQDDLGVPFLVTTDGKCLIGDEPIINYLESLDI